MHKENKPDHWAHALAFWRVGVSQILTSSEVGGVRPMTISNKPNSYEVRKDSSVPVDEALHMKFDRLITKSIERQRRRKIK
jgi:hypothetical protein